jgi:lysophospholipase L1-like esterase
MKTVLCYGDSNTWGYIGGEAERFAPDVRWTGVMQSALGSAYRVIEEGLNGRTTVWDDPIEGGRNGETYLRPCLNTHAPIDLVILMLGTNDLKRRFSLSAYDIAAGAEKLVRLIMASEAGPGHKAPQVLLVCPAAVKYHPDNTEVFGDDAEARSRRMSAYYAAVAERNGCAFVDASTVVTVCEEDGIHLSAQAHSALGAKLADAVRAALC